MAFFDCKWITLSQKIISLSLSASATKLFPLNLKFLQLFYPELEDKHLQTKTTIKYNQ